MYAPRRAGGSSPPGARGYDWEPRRRPGFPSASGSGHSTSARDQSSWVSAGTRARRRRSGRTGNVRPSAKLRSVPDRPGGAETGSEAGSRTHGLTNCGPRLRMYVSYHGTTEPESRATAQKTRARISLEQVDRFRRCDFRHGQGSAAEVILEGSFTPRGSAGARRSQRHGHSRIGSVE